MVRLALNGRVLQELAVCTERPEIVHLVPGGRVYYDNFSLLAREGWRLFEQLARLDPAARPPNISKASTPEELRAYAEHVGFEDLRVRPGELFATVIARKPAIPRSDP